MFVFGFRLLILLGLGLGLSFGLGGGWARGEPAAGRPLRVVLDDSYPPFSFRSADGEIQGLLIDRWRWWEQKTGRRVALEPMPWGQALARMRAGDFDVIDTVFQNRERQQWLEFGVAYQQIAVPIYFDREIAGISDAKSLQGFSVGVKAGDAVIELLQGAGVTTLQRYESYEEILRAAHDRKLSVFAVDQPAALYYLHKFGLSERFRQTAPLNVGAFHRAVAKGQQALLQEVEAGFAAMTADELAALDEKWLGRESVDLRAWFWLLPTAGGLALLVGGLFAWNAMLRRAVQRRMTELRASEERFQSIFHAVSDAIFIHDLGTGRVVDVNEAMERMFGYTRLEAIAASFAALHAGEAPYRQDEAEAYLRRAAQGETPTFAWHCRRRDGTLFWSEVSLRRGRIGGREVVVAVVRDITARKEAEEKLRRTEEQFRQAQKMQAVGQLAGGVAHDFNNIMAAVLLHIGLLHADRRLDPVTREALADLEQEVQRGANLTRQLLAYSRQQVMEKRVLDLNGLCEGLQDMLRRLLGEQVLVELKLARPLPAVLADRGMLEQVIMNLAVNARDAMPQGGRLTLETESVLVTVEQAQEQPEAKAGPGVRLRVSDTGHGMSAETMTHLFEPFFTTKDVGKGAGLGLATVYGIVTQHGGWITAQSAVGRGTTFLVYLPVSEIAAEPERLPEERGALPGGKNETILLVEDDAAVRSIIGQGLRKYGYRVIEAHDGPEAQRLWRKLGDEIDLLFTDMVMPQGLSGLELAKRFREARPELRVIVCTGYSATLAEASELAGPKIEILRKPLDWSVLLTAVRRQIEADRGEKAGEGR